MFFFYLTLPTTPRLKYLSSNNVIIYNSGDGDDFITVGSGHLEIGGGNDSLWGDAGNDTFFYALGDGKDIFIYKPGEGTDHIMDYWRDEGDMLKILKTNGKEGGTFKSASFDGDALTLNISGGGSVIFEDVCVGDKININSKIYTIKGRGLK